MRGYQIYSSERQYRLIAAAIFSCFSVSLFAWLIIADLNNTAIGLVPDEQPSMVQLAARYYGAYALARN